MTTAELVFEPPDVESHSHLARLQGAWVSVEGRRPMDLLIAGKHFTASFKDGALYMGTFYLFDDEHPSEMVMCVEEGPAPHQGRIVWCLYTWIDDDTLRWCPGDPGAEERLTDFPSQADTRHLCTVFRRQHPKRA